MGRIAGCFNLFLGLGGKEKILLLINSIDTYFQRIHFHVTEQSGLSGTALKRARAGFAVA
jgi:hypothetical protein